MATPAELDISHGGRGEEKGLGINGLPQDVESGEKDVGNGEFGEVAVVKQGESICAKCAQILMDNRSQTTTHTNDCTCRCHRYRSVPWIWPCYLPLQSSRRLSRLHHQ